MKTTKLIPIFALLACGPAFGASYCQRESSCSSPGGCTQVTFPQNCASISTYYYGANKVVECRTCMSGYKHEFVGPISFSDCTNTISYRTCPTKCAGCTNCVSDSNFSSYSAGYQRKATRTCDCETCRTTYSYRCAAGYYGSSSNGTSGCSPCPSGGTSSAGTTSATGCYIPSGTTGSDATGTYKYTSNCYWK